MGQKSLYRSEFLDYNSAMTGHPLVLVEWEDSTQPMSGWHWLAGLGDLGVVKCRSVGWLVQDGEMVKVLAPNLGTYEGDSDCQASGVIRIPARAVVRIANLSEAAQPATSLACQWAYHCCAASRPD